jgi:hypothetical protein
MKKISFLLVMVVLLAGCATMTVSDMTANNRMNLAYLSRGISRTKALAIMKSGIGIYDCDLMKSKISSKVTMNNPYRTETLEASGKTLEVIYYITSLKDNDCTIGEDGLTPLVFEDNKLIGWGKDFLSEVFPAGLKPVQTQPVQPDVVQAPMATK